MSTDANCGSLKDGSMSNKEVSIFHKRIDSLTCQNKVNVQRLHALESEDEQRRKELIERDKMIENAKKDE